VVNRARGAWAVATALSVMLLPACTSTEGTGLRPNPPDTGTLTSTFVLQPGDVFSEGMV